MSHPRRGARPFANAIATGVAAALALACGGCQAPPPPALPEAEGRGVVEADREPPAGAATWARPTWNVGDRFVLVRGERLRGEFRVTAATPTHYAIDPGNGIELRRDLDLGNLGEWRPDGEPLHVLSPVDARYHWPLWVGKRWSCEFVDRARAGEPVAMRADYLVEDLDTITVPAGTFAALRIVRRLRLVGAPEQYLPRWQIVWYAPALGTELRQLFGDTIVELAEHARAR
jgi:hypothetical protein